MAQGVSGSVQPHTAIAFWEHLSAVLTDEVVLAEAVAVGMDWPEVADGRAQLAASRRQIVREAIARHWLARSMAGVFLADDAQVALAAARPWIEEAQQQTLAEATPTGPLLAEA